MVTFTNSGDPDEMPHHAILSGSTLFVKVKKSSDKNTIIIVFC